MGRMTDYLWPINNVSIYSSVLDTIVRAYEFERDPWTLEYIESILNITK